jgi:hypothetical protein
MEVEHEEDDHDGVGRLYLEENSGPDCQAEI